MRSYQPSKIEPQWQKRWADEQRYRSVDSSDKQKFYISCMFPYPSGAGMHVGHAMEHAVVDATARFQRSLGRNVMNPMGWDAFGLPTENYAIKTGVSPVKATEEFIDNFKEQINSLGSSIDWSREVNTSDPEYYRWTQWIFTQLFRRGLAYQKESLQWWCPVDQTVLANEQVVDGKCWRCGNEVVKKSMKQWFFKITEYADALLDEIANLDWPEAVRTAQTNWIGRSHGADIEFAVEGSDQIITAFTTRPDTLFGATFMVLAPEHPLLGQLVNDDTRQAVESYVAQAVKSSEIDRQNAEREKTGVFTGSYVVNPANGEKMPIWVADYVLWGYGTGAIMAVPAHDERDHAFASKYDLPIIRVIDQASSGVDSSVAYSGDGKLVNSGAFSGRESSEVREDVVAWLEQEKIGSSQTTYKMRDWLISRQRYWGAPIPIVHCPKHGAVAVPEDQLPIKLPDMADFAPKGDGKSPLARDEDWVSTACPECGGPAQRETDVMDGYACSSWYLLRYTDPNNDEQAWDRDLADYWMPVDYYVGGDHATAHLLYVRFWNHVFHDMKLVPTKEPVKKLVYHGLILAEDGRKMSKSLGNVIDPREVISQGYGADSLRTFLLFVGPINENSAWSSSGIAGVYRFLNRVWTLIQEFKAAQPAQESSSDADLVRLRHQTVKKVTNDYRQLHFNTAIAAMMEMTNEMYKLKTAGFSEAWREVLLTLVQLLAPMAPHMAAELWQQMGQEEWLDTASWPAWDEAQLVADTMTIAVQVNGKLRATVEVPADADQSGVETAALADKNVVAHLGNRKPTKIIYVPGRLVNVVVK